MNFTSLWVYYFRHYSYFLLGVSIVCMRRALWFAGGIAGQEREVSLAGLRENHQSEQWHTESTCSPRFAAFSVTSPPPSRCIPCAFQSRSTSLADIVCRIDDLRRPSYIFLHMDIWNIPVKTWIFKNNVMWIIVNILVHVHFCKIFSTLDDTCSFILQHAQGVSMIS